MYPTLVELKRKKSHFVWANYGNANAVSWFNTHVGEYGETSLYPNFYVKKCFSLDENKCHRFSSCWLFLTLPPRSIHIWNMTLLPFDFLKQLFPTMTCIVATCSFGCGYKAQFSSYNIAEIQQVFHTDFGSLPSHMLAKIYNILCSYEHKHYTWNTLYCCFIYILLKFPHSHRYDILSVVSWVSVWYTCTRFSLFDLSIFIYDWMFTLWSSTTELSCFLQISPTTPWWMLALLFVLHW